MSELLKTIKVKLAPDAGAKQSLAETMHVFGQHVISRRIVNDLQAGDTLVLEDLTHIRERAKQRKAQRADFHSWAFGQLQAFLIYKAREKGCHVLFVDPRYSSQLCSMCGAPGQRSGHRFSCSACGHVAHSDFNSCYNLVRRASLAPSDGLSSTGPKATRRLQLQADGFNRQ